MEFRNIILDLIFRAYQQRTLNTRYLECWQDDVSDLNPLILASAMLSQRSRDSTSSSYTKSLNVFHLPEKKRLNEKIDAFSLSISQSQIDISQNIQSKYSVYVLQRGICVRSTSPRSLTAREYLSYCVKQVLALLWHFMTRY